MKKLLILSVITGLVFIYNSPVQAVTYSYTTVDVPDSTWQRITSINDSGLVVGTFGYGDGIHHGFTYDGATYNIFNYPGDASTRFTAINNNGEITGEYLGDDWTGLKYDGSTWTSISFPGSPRSSGAGINDSGHMVGWYRDADYCAGYGFLYDGTTYTSLDFPGTDESACQGVAPWPPDETRAFGINDSDKIVGVYIMNNTNHGFIYDNGSWSTLDYLGSPKSFATEINDTGKIVGQYVDAADNEWYGYMYDNGIWSTLSVPETFYATTAGIHYTTANGINNKGVIVGNYGVETGKPLGFIATPVVPEPASTALFLVGSGVFGLAGLRRKFKAKR